MRRALLHVLLPLVIGAFVYVAFRAEEVRLVGWLPAASVSAARTSVRAVSLPAILLGSASDAAWGWSFGAAMALVWRGRPRRARTLWLVVGGLVAAWAEVGQIWGLPPGTFDVVDLLAIILAYAGAALLVSRESAKGPELGDPGRGDGAGGPAVPER